MGDGLGEVAENMAWIREEPDGPYVVAKACTICDRPIPDSDYPLCRRCLGTAEAVGRQEAEQTRFLREYGDDSHDRRMPQ